MAICHFLKPETNKGDFRLYFKLVEKGCGGRHDSEISKTNTKTLIYSIWIYPQGSLGCRKMHQGPLNMPFKVCCNNIVPKLENIQNTLRKKRFFWHVLITEEFNLDERNGQLIRDLSFQRNNFLKVHTLGICSCLENLII